MQAARAQKKTRAGGGERKEKVTHKKQSKPELGIGGRLIQVTKVQGRQKTQPTGQKQANCLHLRENSGFVELNRGRTRWSGRRWGAREKNGNGETISRLGGGRGLDEPASKGKKGNRFHPENEVLIVRSCAGP